MLVCDYVTMCGPMFIVCMWVHLLYIQWAPVPAPPQPHMLGQNHQLPSDHRHDREHHSNISTADSVYVGAGVAPKESSEGKGEGASRPSLTITSTTVLLTLRGLPFLD